MDNWAKDLAEKYAIQKTALARTDMSLGPLNSLAADGYVDIEWQTTTPVPCSICEDLNRQRWDMNSYLSTVHHDAGIFSHSHVNCYCILILRSPGLPDRTLDSYGNIG
jgi:hypothetical protein